MTVALGFALTSVGQSPAVHRAVHEVPAREFAACVRVRALKDQQQPCPNSSIHAHSAAQQRRMHAFTPTRMRARAAPTRQQLLTATARDEAGPTPRRWGRGQAARRLNEVALDCPAEPTDQKDDRSQFWSQSWTPGGVRRDRSMQPSSRARRRRPPTTGSQRTWKASWSSTTMRWHG